MRLVRRPALPQPGARLAAVPLRRLPRRSGRAVARLRARRAGRTNAGRLGRRGRGGRGSARFEQALEFVRGQRTAAQVALELVAAERLKEFELRGVLDAFKIGR